MAQLEYRWMSPPGGPAKRSDDLAAWATGELLGRGGVILANIRDLPALRCTMLAERVDVPEHGVVQPGTLWFASEVAAC